MSKRVLPVSPDVYDKVVEIAQVANKGLRQAVDDLLEIAFEQVWVGLMTTFPNGVKHKAIFTKGTNDSSWEKAWR